MTNTNTTQNSDNTNPSLLFIKEGGTKEGDPIIFVHGLLGSHIYWEKQFNHEELKRYRLISYDLRGHGLSLKTNVETDYNNIKVWADDLKSVIQSCGLSEKKITFVGWSLGVAVISDYICEHGTDTVAGAIYIDPLVNHKFVNPDILLGLYPSMINEDLTIRNKAIAEFINKCFKKIEKTLLDSFLVSAGMASNFMLKNAIHDYATEEATDRILSKNIPLVVLLGENSVPIKTNDLRDFFKNKFNSRITPKGWAYKVHTIYDTGHGLHIENPERLSQEINNVINYK